MDYSYHNHTYLCSHATGTMEEYIEVAIENGIKHMGFSDHIPFVRPDGEESYYRVPVDKGKMYCDDVKALGEKYKDEIEIIVGFESEYYDEYFDGMLRDAIEYGAEYLILGQHFTEPEVHGARHTVDETESLEELKKYVDSVVLAMEKKVFTYVAHPDIVNYTGDIKVYKEEVRKICKVSKKLNIPLEINFLGIRGKRSYPRELFWEVAGDEKSPVTFGFDAHSAKDAYDGESLVVAIEWVRRYNLNYIGKPEIINIQNIK